MKIKVEVDLEDFYEGFTHETLTAELLEVLKAEVLKLVKRDPRWKSFIKKQADDTLNRLEL